MSTKAENKKFKDMDKKKLIRLAVIAVIVIGVGVGACVGLSMHRLKWETLSKRALFCMNLTQQMFRLIYKSRETPCKNQPLHIMKA